MAQANVPPGAEFAYEVAHGALEDQLRRIEVQDSKAGILIAAAGVFGGFIFSSDSFLRSGPAWVVILAGGLVIAAVVAALLASMNQRYVTAPAAVAVARLAAREAPWLKWRFVGNLHLALDWNREKLNRKTRFLVVAQGLFMLAVLIVGGYFVVSAV